MNRYWTLDDFLAVIIGMTALIIVAVIACPIIFVYENLIQPRVEARQRLKSQKELLKRAVEEIEHERRLRRET